MYSEMKLSLISYNYGDTQDMFLMFFKLPEDYLYIMFNSMGPYPTKFKQVMASSTIHNKMFSLSICIYIC